MLAPLDVSVHQLNLARSAVPLYTIFVTPWKRTCLDLPDVLNFCLLVGFSGKNSAQILHTNGRSRYAIPRYFSVDDFPNFPWWDMDSFPGG